jgi:hypothetical protein
MFIRQNSLTTAAALLFLEFQNKASFVIPAVGAGAVRQANFIALRAAG